MQQLCSYRFLYAVLAGFLGLATGTAATPSLVVRGVFPDAAGDLIEEVKVVGSYAYLANGYAGLRIVDISDPSAPHLVSELALAEGCLARGVAVEGSMAYVADWFTGVYAIDVSDPSHPTITDHYEGATFIDVEAVGSYAYVCSYPDGLSAFDALDPTNLERVSHGGTSRANALATRGQYAYVSAISGGMVIFDLGNPAEPVRISQFQTDDYYVYEVAVVGDYAYTIERSREDRRLNVVDVSDARNPWSVGYLTVTSGDFLAASEGFVVIGDVGGKLQLVSVSDRESPRLLSTYYMTQPSNLGASRRPCFSGGLWYWPNGENGLKILSIEESPSLEIARSEGAGSLQLDWERLPGARLQRSTSLAAPNWEDIPDPEVPGGDAIAPVIGSECFFRVLRDIE